MSDKFLELLDAEIAHMEKTKNLSEKEQIKADKKWMNSKEHKQLAELLTEAILLDK